MLNKLRKYNSTTPKKVNATEETLHVVEKLLKSIQEVVDAFKTGTFPYKDGRINFK